MAPHKYRSKRRTDVVSGFVNFPVHDPNLPSDRQGGMFVRLVVSDTRVEENYHDRWVVCCGGYQNFRYDECYIRDNVAEKNLIKGTNTNLITDEEYDSTTNESFHFPWLHLVGEKHQYESRSYLCVMTIGSTGWSNTEWTCTYEDLTEKGKTLYNLIQELYTGCEVHLLTWLDT